MPRKYVVREGSQIRLSPHHPASTPPPPSLAPAVGVERHAVPKVEALADAPRVVEHLEGEARRLLPGIADALAGPGMLVLERPEGAAETGPLAVHDVPAVDGFKRRHRGKKHRGEETIPLDWDNIRIESNIDDDVGEGFVTSGDDCGVLAPVLTDRDGPEHEGQDVRTQHSSGTTRTEEDCQASDGYVQDRIESEEGFSIMMQVNVSVPQDQLQ